MCIDLIYDTNVPVREIYKAPSKPKRLVDIKKKLKDLEEDQILNVSKLAETGGTGIRKLKYNSKKAIFQTQDERIESDNYDAFIRTINLIPKGEEKYDKDIERAKVYFDITDKPATKAKSKTNKK